MTPDYAIALDGEDISGKFGGLLMSLTITDEDGEKSDRLQLELDDAGGRIAFPETGALLDVRLGFRQTGLSYMGRFSVDKVAGSAMPRTMTISGTAAGMKGPIRAPRTRSWRDVRLSDIVNRIAGEAGLTPIVGASIAGTFYPFIAQTAESNLHFITRLAKDLDATAKPADGHLVVVKKDEGVNAKGTPIEPVRLAASAFQSWSWEVNERANYKKVEAEWSDVDGGKTERVVVGDGEPVRRLRHVFGSKDEAIRAAEAELEKAGRASLTLDGDLASFYPALFAGGLIDVSGLRSGVDGRYLLKTVEHGLQGALTTSFKAERSRR